ncbi:putative late blight resistance protein homolog R1C-3 [Andrographis paniculata]|uniref:putative late blight resistance protein homolog R1C-3 n=1 Tax=Andrographis paniculata TaxID=175694 RepID=UPI0021E96F58|nr:putative late blight resistance protein homolog R1C-3 [Andrographis paniculata]
MAAYAALLSVTSLIDQIQNHPCSPPITLDENDILVASLSTSITCLREFLESYYSISRIEESSGELTERLERRIADVAYAAADLIESHIHDQASGIEIDDHFDENLHQVIDHMSSIAMETKEKQLQYQHLIINDSFERPAPSTGLKSTSMVGFDDVFNEVLDKLMADQSNRRIIPIVGMGGIGKTTLASNAYENQSVVQHFDVRSWVVVSQDYDVRDILSKVLVDLNKGERGEMLRKVSEEEVGEKVHKSLFGRRYLIVLDDMWSIQVWNKISRYFVENNNRSRIIITTRLSNVASELSHNKVVMDFLDDQKSWNLLCNVVFGGSETCPSELEESGRKIAMDCKGLPLSIIVMGGILVKSTQTRKDWEFIADKLNLSIALEREEHCLQILRTSFDHLPVHLKPCFLYLGIFAEDKEIKTSNLVKLLVAEGFVKPIFGKSMELAAEEYIMDLVDRNLVLATVIGSTGKPKVCIVHDLVRDLCIREAERQRFLCVARKSNLSVPQGIDGHRRVAIHRSTLKDEHLLLVLDALRPASRVHSVMCDIIGVFPRPPSRTLRILNLTNRNSLDSRQSEWFFEDVLRSVNLRFLAFNPHLSREFSFSSSIYLLWNLQTLIINKDFLTPFEIWKMPQLKHVKVTRLCLPDPPSNGHVLANLQTLSCVINFKCDEAVVKRIPNIRRLKIAYGDVLKGGWSKNYYLSNLGRLQKLESFSCWFSLSTNSPSRSDCFQKISFPESLVKLEAYSSPFSWEEITTNIGALPHLQVLKLKFGVRGREWNLVDGKFRSLRFLLIHGVRLKHWTAESQQFPRLERISLAQLYELKEIPLGIGDAPKLRSIDMEYCHDSVVISAQEILDEQDELGNAGGLKVRVLAPLARRFVELRPNTAVDLDL